MKRRILYYNSWLYLIYLLVVEAFIPGPLIIWDRYWISMEFLLKVMTRTLSAFTGLLFFYWSPKSKCFEIRQSETSSQENETPIFFVFCSNILDLSLHEVRYYFCTTSSCLLQYLIQTSTRPVNCLFQQTLLFKITISNWGPTPFILVSANPFCF